MYLIPEWLPHKCCFLAWPCNKELYKSNLTEAKKQISTLANTISDHEKVIILCNNEDLEEVKYFLKNKAIKVIKVNLDDSWMRDIAPIFFKKDNLLVSMNFQFNGYGKYPNFKKDNLIAGQIAKILDIKIYESNIILEGGAITYDEFGNLFTTKNVIFNKNRNQILSHKEIDKKLIKLFDLRKIYYFPEGLVDDDTDGHIDNIFCPIGNNRYLIASADKNNKNYFIFKKNKRFIENEFKKNHQKYELISIPLPSETIIDNKIIIGSYINFYFTKYSVIIPKFNVPQDDIVKKIFLKLFKDKEVIFLDTTSINYGGGNIHCVTMNVPKI